MEDDFDIQQVKQAGGWLTLISDIRAGRSFRESSYWNALTKEIHKSSVDLEPGWQVFRARCMTLDREDDAEPFAPNEMGPPPLELALPQRLSPGKTRCFYGALDRDTAIAETRPWRRARLSVARFASTTGLKVLDLSGIYGASHPSPELQWVSFILGRPIHPDDQDSYLPSQAIAHECRDKGFHGLLYNSALRRDGVNAAIFSFESLKCLDRELVEVLDLSYSIASFGTSHDG